METILPNKALEREIQRARLDAAKKGRKLVNSGYSHGAASRRKKSMQGWDSTTRSPHEDIGKNLNLLRQRTRDLAMNTPIGAAAISRNTNNVIGAGLTLKCKINYRALGITQEEAKKWMEDTEQEFAMWAEEKMDSTGLNNFYDMQRIMLQGWLMNGDSLAVITYDLKNETKNPYQMRIRLIEADRLSTPNCYSDEFQLVKLQNGGMIYNGVETDESGKIVAYHIANQYPNSVLKMKQMKWTRIKAINRVSGLPNVLFVVNQERAEQYRGVPLLAPVVEQIKQMSRYTEAEITAAIINSFFTVFITSDEPNNDFTLESGIPQNEQIDLQEEDELVSYELGPGTINQLKPGEKVEFGDPKHPASGFEVFCTTIAKLIGAAIDIPHEVLLSSFNDSYSASRAALLQAWRGFKAKRTWFANDFCRPVYEIWLWEAVATGRIKAPGFFDNYKIRKLWSAAEWIGPAPGQVDPVKEVTAAKMRIAEGLSTRSREALEMNGTDFENNAETLKVEQEKMQEILGGNQSE